MRPQHAAAALAFIINKVDQADAARARRRRRDAAMLGAMFMLYAADTCRGSELAHNNTLDYTVGVPTNGGAETKQVPLVTLLYLPPDDLDKAIGWLTSGKAVLTARAAKGKHKGMQKVKSIIRLPRCAALNLAVWILLYVACDIQCSEPCDIFRPDRPAGTAPVVKNVKQRPHSMNRTELPNMTDVDGHYVFRPLLMMTRLDKVTRAKFRDALR
jgi:hypothetical protein